jgi:hypothetical protein
MIYLCNILLKLKSSKSLGIVIIKTKPNFSLSCQLDCMLKNKFNRLISFLISCSKFDKNVEKMNHMMEKEAINPISKMNPNNNIINHNRKCLKLLTIE